MNVTQLSTYLEVALASVQTTMMEIEKWEDAPEIVADAFCELEQAYARIVLARRSVMSLSAKRLKDVGPRWVLPLRRRAG